MCIFVHILSSIGIMSAIWGIIDTKDKRIDDSLVSIMNNQYDKYIIDKVIEKKIACYYIACGIQYITRESYRETLPIEDDDIIFAADIMLDNNHELIEELNLETDVPDGYIMYRAYKTWGMHFLDHIYGVFSFMIFDKRTKEVIVGRDHCGARSIYFSVDNGRIVFSTLLSPIRVIFNLGINERYLTDYIGLLGLAHISECEETIYENAYIVAPGEYVVISGDNIKRVEYYNPTRNLSKINLKSDEEYKNLFLNTFNIAVKSTLRTEDNIGILLSSGLDSTSVACVASILLGNKTLKSYTSVPLKDYVNDVPRYYKPDESAEVKKLASVYKNIENHFISCEGKDAYSNIYENLDIYEAPYKVIQNNTWLSTILEEAHKDGCRIVLNGQCGNGTISFGDINTHLVTLLSEKKFKDFFRELKNFSIVYRCGRKDILKNLFNSVKGTTIDPIQKNIIKDCFIEKYKIDDRLWHDTSRIKPLEKDKTVIYHKISLSQIGELETKSSLKNGLIIRDSTRDRRIYELILSFPSDQFVRDGITRRLVREYLKGIVPEFILRDDYRRGLQSADWYYRLNKRWKEIYLDIKENILDETLSYYIDQDYVECLLESIENGVNDDNEDIVRVLIYLSIVSVFIKKEKETYLQYMEIDV